MRETGMRVHAHETFHHIVSRIAHKVFFLKEDERNDFLMRLKRVAIFSGIEPVGWCVMTNHFHILAYLPERKDLSEEEVIDRYGALKGQSRAEELEGRLAAMRRNPGGAALAEAELARIKARMYSIPEFVKILKQWTTEDYNKRYGHTGTLWESPYRDRAVRGEFEALSETLVYIHLNPVRAGLSSGFDDYPWSSLSAFRRGDAMAARGMRLVYGHGRTDDQVAAAHKAHMAERLEEMKRKWAVEVARRRAAGYTVPDDPLTDEAMVAQAAAHLREVQKAGTELYEERRRGRPRKEGVEEKILKALSEGRSMKLDELMAATGLPKSSLYRSLDKMKKAGKVWQERHGGPVEANSHK